MGSGGVAIAALPTVICLKVPFSDGLGRGNCGKIGREGSNHHGIKLWHRIPAFAISY